ncbi:MAG: hypothetical protein AAGB34_03235 [Planctomycetota bacterium]
MINHPSVVAFAVVMATCSHASTQLNVSILDLGTEENQFQPEQLSGDGRTVIGTFFTDRDLPVPTETQQTYRYTRPYRWTVESGNEFLPVPDRPIDTTSRFFDASAAYSVNYDGSVIVGTTNSSAFRWTREDGYVDLNNEWGATRSSAVGVSDDGQRVIGRRYYAGVSNSPYGWDSNSGFFLPESTIEHADRVSPGVISGDGKVVFGSYLFDPPTETRPNPPSRVFRWSEESGHTPIETIAPAEDWNTSVSGTNRNGTVMYGTVWDPIGLTRKAFVWDEQSGMSYLEGDPVPLSVDLENPQVKFSAVSGITADGSLLFGNYLIGILEDDPFHAFVWTKESGIVEFNDYLEQLGIDLSDELGDGRVVALRSVSDDGRTFLTGYQYEDEGFDFVVLTILAPSGAVVLMLTGLAVTRRRRTSM